MMEKIEWYREVLELEPNSKVFFPLARLLVDNGGLEEAIGVLEHGLERHPDFMEARLFLIELLYKNGQKEACDKQIERLSAMFAKYAGFWQAWAACLSSRPGEEDTASIVRFLAAHFLAGPVKIYEALNLGISEIIKRHSSGDVDQTGKDKSPALSEQKADSSNIPAREEEILEEALSGDPESESVTKAPVKRAAGAAVDLSSFTPARPGDQANFEETDSVTPVLVNLEEAFPSPPPDSVEGSKINFNVETPEEEPFSLRTRSMAEVLADQGDYQGAIDIYQELAASETDPVEAENIQRRMAELQAMIYPKSIEEDAPIEAEASPSRKKEKLLGILETLARRVEARMHN